MPQRTRERIEKGLYIVNGVVYMERTKGGVLCRRKAPVQFSAALNSRRQPTADLRRAYREFLDGVENEAFREMRRARSVAPTPERLAEAYRAAAALRFAQHRQPRQRTVDNNVTAFLALCRDVGAERVDRLTPQAVGEWVAGRAAGSDRARVTAWSTLAQARSLWAAWTIEGYERAGIVIPVCLARWPRGRARAVTRKYMRPPEELRAATMAWYAGLEESDQAAWAAATLMVQFAMRPADAARLRWEDFEARPDGNLTLVYVPAKTRDTTAAPRPVRWPAAAELLARMRAAGGAEHVVPGACEADRYALFSGRLNPAMRALGWERARWGKACYELRKMCVDGVRRRFGLDRSVQISGDSPSTVQDYYSDPNDDAIGPVDLSLG